jgi:chaperonin GroES
MNIRPILDRVLVEPIEEPTTTKSGLHLVKFEKEKPNIGVILAIGPGKYNDRGNFQPTSLKAGQKIMYSKHVGMNVNKEAPDGLLIMREEDVMGLAE